MECEVCKNDFKSLDKHHIQSKSKGGSNKSWNIANLCPNCHRSVHLGDIVLEGKYNTTMGMVLFYHYKNDNFVVCEDQPEVYIMNKEKSNGIL